MESKVKIFSVCLKIIKNKSDPVIPGMIVSMAVKENFGFSIILLKMQNISIIERM